MATKNIGLKVLPLEFWMKLGDDEEDRWMPEYTHANEIKPKLGRDGYYLDRLKKQVWFEVNGRAFVGSCTVGDFEYRLHLFNHRPLGPAEIEAIKTLKRRGIRNRELIALLHFDCDWKSIRETYRHSLMIATKGLKRFKQGRRLMANQRSPKP